MRLLKMREHLKLGAVPAMLDEFVAHKPAGREKQAHALPEGAQTAVNVGLGHQRQARAESRIAARPQRMPEGAAFARFADLSLRKQVVAGAEQLEIVQVIDDGNVLRFQYPEDGRRDMMIDIAHMSNVRTEFLDHGPDAPPRLQRIDQMPRAPQLLPETGVLFEINVRHEMP